MTRRNRSRLPPKLPETPRAAPVKEAAPPSIREQLKLEHVAGRSARFGREEVVALMRRVAAGAPAVRLGLDAFGPLSLAQVETAVAAVYGWEGDGPRARIAATRTVDAFDAACNRMFEVARVGGRLAFATARPASLLPLHCALADAAASLGAEIAQARESAPFGAGGRRLRWIDGVAVVADQQQLLGDDDVHAAEELLFTLPRPDLVVADRCFAGVALAAGLEAVAFADLDALALAVAAHRGRSLRLVPLDERRPPVAYEPLRDRLEVLRQQALQGETPGAAADACTGAHTAL
jgi:hypothetical protein